MVQWTSFRSAAIRLTGVVLVCLLAACGVPKEKYDADIGNLKSDSAAALKAAHEKAQDAWKKQNDKLKGAVGQLNTQKKRGDKLAADLKNTQHALEQCTSKGGNAAKGLAQCTIDRKGLKDRLSKVMESINKVRSALKAMSDAGKLRVKLERGFLIIALQGDILFDSGQSKLKKDAEPVLTELAAVLKLLPGRLFQVAGHTDSQGDVHTNWTLSMKRALTVVEFLHKAGELPDGALAAGGYAHHQPVANNDTKEGRAQNRRVEFLLVPNLEELLKI
jgi:chemotaxis protein MotB